MAAQKAGTWFEPGPSLTALVRGLIVGIAAVYAGTLAGRAL
jgi:hypothetical protein